MNLNTKIFKNMKETNLCLEIKGSVACYDLKSSGFAALFFFSGSIVAEGNNFKDIMSRLSGHHKFSGILSRLFAGYL
jgi:hypothetical protein